MKHDHLISEDCTQSCPLYHVPPDPGRLALASAKLARHEDIDARIRELHQRRRALIRLEPCSKHASLLDGKPFTPGTFTRCPDCIVQIDDTCVHCTAKWPCRTTDLLNGIDYVHAMAPRDEEKAVTRQHEAGHHEKCAPYECDIARTEHEYEALWE